MLEKQKVSKNLFNFYLFIALEKIISLTYVEESTVLDSHPKINGQFNSKMVTTLEIDFLVELLGVEDKFWVAHKTTHFLSSKRLSI